MKRSVDIAAGDDDLGVDDLIAWMKEIKVWFAPTPDGDGLTLVPNGAEPIPEDVQALARRHKAALIRIAIAHQERASGHERPPPAASAPAGERTANIIPLRPNRVDPETGEIIEAPAGERPALDAGDNDLGRATRAAWEVVKAVNDREPGLFRYGDLLTRLDRDEDGSLVPRTLTEDRLRNVLADVACWKKRNGKGDLIDAYPPVPVVRNMLADPVIPLPPLTAITASPSFAPDGTLHIAPGYYPPGRTYYHPAAGLKIPAVAECPTDADVCRARSLILDDLLGDFPFIGDAERANAVALLIQPHVRSMVDGPTPLFLIEKPAPGTGASLLADVLTYPSLGRPIAAMTEGRDEDEWRKRLTAKFRSGTSHVLIDNLRRRLDSATLASAITALEWEDRILGTSDQVHLPVRVVWVATGNNPALSSEMLRRSIRIRIDAKTDRPWLRETQEFRHPNLRKWCIEHRGDLIWASLTLVRAWIAKGQPAAKDAPTLGMFESWARVMGGVLGTAGIPGFLTNLTEFYDKSDTEGEEIRSFLSAWWDKIEDAPVLVSDLFAIALGSDLDVSAKTEQGQKVRLGQIVRSLEDRRYQLSDELIVRIERAGTRGRAVLWRLDRDGGSESPHRDSLPHARDPDAVKSPRANTQSESDESFPNPRAYAPASARIHRQPGKDSSDSQTYVPVTFDSALGRENRESESSDTDSPDACGGEDRERYEV